MTLVKILLIFQAAVFGAIIGSFLNVCVYRIPLRLSLWGRSFCPACHHSIPLYRNVPLLSYILQRSRAACCQAPIPWHYPVVEALTAVLSVLTLLRVAADGSVFLDTYFIWFLLFVCPLLVISVIDFRLMIIPDVISLPFLVIGFFVQIYLQRPDVLGALLFSGLGMLFGGGLLLALGEIVSRLKKMDAMGGGDIKIAAMMGSFLGWRAMIFVFFASSFFALFYVVGLKIFQRSSSGPHFPFGPFLAMGAVTAFLYGKTITDWYFAHLNGVNPLF